VFTAVNKSIMSDVLLNVQMGQVVIFCCAMEQRKTDSISFIWLIRFIIM